MTARFKNPITQKLADFIVSVGIEVRCVHITEKTFLPGILVEEGKILVDEFRLSYPGDLLHEAGHLAVAPSALRSTLGGEVKIPNVPMQRVEAAAIAWSYAAVLHLGLDPQVVFHEGGYGVGSERLLSNFSLGVYIGVNGLEDAGLTSTGSKAKELGVPPYPYMLKWLRTEG